MFSDPDRSVLPRQDAARDGGIPLAEIRYAFLIIFIIAAVLTPTADPWNQTVFAAPMVGLYLISILIVWLVEPKGQATDKARGVYYAPLLVAIFVIALVMFGPFGFGPRGRVRGTSYFSCDA